jgi:hypothetical protein
MKTMIDISRRPSSSRHRRATVSAFAALTAVLAISFTCDSAAQGNDLDYFAAIKGKCTSLILRGSEYTRACIPRVLNEVFTDSRTGFTFTAGDTAVISFSGIGRLQKKDDPNHVTQPLDMVIVSLIGMGARPNKIRATGACTYSNPNVGAVKISCSAHTEMGQFEGKFLSDGQPPEIRQF